MSKIFEVEISRTPSSGLWGEQCILSFSANGAIIHLENSDSTAVELQKTQKAARKLAQMNLPACRLVGAWSREAQWHFWQGIFSFKNMPQIEFSKLSDKDKSILANQIKTIGWAKKLVNDTPEDLYPMSLATQAGEFISQLDPKHVSYKIISGEALKQAGALRAELVVI